MAIKLDKPLQVGDWQYLPEQDKLVQLAADGKIAVTADLDNLSQKVANYFIVNAGKLITKDELLHDVWGIRDVSDGRVTRVIRVLRVALGDDTREPRYIETIPKRGYRFIAPVTVLQPVADIASDTPAEAPVGDDTSGREKSTLPWYAAVACMAIAIITWWLWPTVPEEQDKSASDIPMLRYKPVTALDGLEFYHNVSDDERYLVYSHASPKDENVTVLMLQDLQEHRRIQLTDPSYSSFGAVFSPDGNKIAYHRMYTDGRCEIRVVELRLADFSAGEDQIFEVCGQHSVSSRITWSPDGAYLVYPTMSEQKQMVIMLKPLAGGKSEQLTAPPPSSFGDFAARFSRTGNQLAFLRDAAGSAQIWLLDLSTRETRMLLKVGDVYPGNIDWDVDNKSIIYPSASTTLSKINVESGKVTVVAYTDFNALEVQVTKNGKLFATVGNVAHVNINKVTNITLNTNYKSETVFSSNRNETLAEANPIQGGPTAVVSRRSGLPQVWLFYPDGNQKQITFFEQNERFRSLVFSPDGRRLIAQVNNTLWLLSENSPPQQLEGIGENLIASPSWGYKGDMVFYAESKNGRWNIMSSIITTDISKPTLFAEDRELYIESYDGKYSVWRDALDKRFYIQWSNDKSVEALPITLSENQLWLKVQAKSRGIYYTYLIDDIRYKLKFFDLQTKVIADAVAVEYLYHSRFSLSADESFVYILEAVRGDFDIAEITLP